MKDNFSQAPERYLKFRPTYPAQLYDFLIPLVETRAVALDCGTGNGQVAAELSKYFKEVYATDISAAQLKNAALADNIFYSVEPAEKTSFPDAGFNLVTVAQAIHWFNFDEFYKEIRRIIKPAGILAVIGYGLIEVDEDTDKVIAGFYRNIIGPYWDKERKYIDEHYQTIPFPFKEIASPQLYNTFEWTLEQLTGYIETWSAVQHFKKANNSNPLDAVYPELQKLWEADKIKKVQFPILLRVGRV